jgi:hypothetical protein
VGSATCPLQEVVTCGWNNAPRYLSRFTKLEVPSIKQFSAMMDTIAGTPASGRDFPLLCNAWNEWSEGAAIEPCSYLGNALLTSYLGTERGLVDECRYEQQV